MSVQEKQNRLLDALKSYGRVAVAFSGGVDSAVVCQAAFLACGPECVAVTASSPSVASGEVQNAVEVAQRIGIRHVILETQEFENPDYTRNPADRCRYCKTELYSQIAARQQSIGFDVIVNGANQDDLGDYRPGLQAAAEYHVRSPLVEAGCTKADVRQLAREWQLSVWDKPATPCLSSRVAYGVEVTPQRLRQIDAAERFLREKFGLAELRVRCEANEHARVEVPLESLPVVVQAEPAVGAIA